MGHKLAKLGWFGRRPALWPQMVSRGLRKFYPRRDGPAFRAAATAWAADRGTTPHRALVQLGLLAADEPMPALPEAVRAAGHARAQAVPVEMGWPGDLDLIYASARRVAGRHFLETGVAYGWSSLAVLAAIADRDGARLISVDMPYPLRGNDAYVGAVVPDELRASWRLMARPDWPGLGAALRQFGHVIDWCHYDSDKSYWGRRYAYPRLWAALRPGGVFLSDDIQDNHAFQAFVEARGLTYAVVASGDKYVGLIRK